jgi:hypothetical protein
MSIFQAMFKLFVLQKSNLCGIFQDKCIKWTVGFKGILSILIIEKLQSIQNTAEVYFSNTVKYKEISKCIMK